MTNEEAIKWLKEGYPSENWKNADVVKWHKAKDSAIKALEKLQKIEDIISAEACWIFDEDGNDNHVVFVEDLEEILKDD